MLKNAFILSVIAWAFAAGNPQHAYASIFQNISDLNESVNFAQTSPFDGVGLFTGDDANGDSFIAGSGVFIGNGLDGQNAWILTAGHVLFANPNELWQSQQFNASADVGANLTNFLDVEEVFPFPGFTNSEAGGGTGNDIGLVKLSSPINNIAAATLFSGPDDVLIGAEFITAGYGNSGIFGALTTGGFGTEVFDFDGVRRGGRNVIDSAGAFFNPQAFAEEQFFVSNFSPLPSNTFPLQWQGSKNDSGSPWLVDVNGEYQIAGIVNGGLTSNTATFGIRTALYNDFITTTIQANSVPEPGAMGLLTLGLMGIAMRRRKGESHA